MSMKTRGGETAARTVMSRKGALFLCLGSFFTGLFFSNRMWTVPEEKNLESKACNPQPKVANHMFNNSLLKVSEPRYDIQTLDNKISSLETKLVAAKAEHQSLLYASPASGNMRRKYFMVIGINTAFSSRKRRDSVRATWMPQGDERKKLEKEKGIIIRFVIGHSMTAGGILDKAIEAEEMTYGDFLKLEHVEGYRELSAKTKTYLITALALWDAEFYVKVDDDIHVNIGSLATVLAGHRMNPRVYIGCMKSGPVRAKRGVKYHEPEYWKFGDKYFRHASGQLYAISKDLATYVSVNQHVLHKYANEDVSLGSWFIGLDVKHVDDRRLCCGTPPDCEWKAHICSSVDRIMELHKHCGEGSHALRNASF